MSKITCSDCWKIDIKAFIARGNVIIFNFSAREREETAEGGRGREEFVRAPGAEGSG